MHDSPFVVNHTIVRFKKNEVERGVMMSILYSQTTLPRTRWDCLKT